MKAVFEYKCRRCNTIFDGGDTAPAMAVKTLYGATLRPETRSFCPSVNMVVVHSQCNAGIGDLIGYRLESEDTDGCS